MRGARRVGEEAREGGGEGRERGVAARGGGTVRAQHDGIRAGTQPSLRSERRDAFGDVSVRNGGSVIAGEHEAIVQIYPSTGTIVLLC